MASISDLCITYGASLAPAGFRKLTLANGGLANLNKDFSESSPSFLWYSCSEEKSPIVEVNVCKANESPASNFEKIPRNIIKGCGKTELYICIRRKVSTDASARTEGNGDATECAGDLRLEKISLLQGTSAPPTPAAGTKIRCITITRSEDGDAAVAVVDIDEQRGGAPAGGGSSLTLCFHMTAVVADKSVDVSPSTSNDPDSTVESSTAAGSSSEIPIKKIPGTLWKLTLGELQQKGKLLAENCRPVATFDAKYHRFWTEMLPIFVRNVLVCQFAVDSEEEAANLPESGRCAPVPVINDFLLNILRTIVEESGDAARTGGTSESLAAAQLAEVEDSRVLLMHTILLNNRRFRWYYDHYGVGFTDEDKDLKVASGNGDGDGEGLLLDGPFAKSVQLATEKTTTVTTKTEISRLLYSNINSFGRMGGFDMLLARLTCRGDKDGSGMMKMWEMELFSLLIIRMCDQSFASYVDGTNPKHDAAAGANDANTLLSVEFMSEFIPIFACAMRERLLSVTPADTRAVEAKSFILTSPLSLWGTCSFTDCIALLYRILENLLLKVYKLHCCNALRTTALVTVPAEIMPKLRPLPWSQDALYELLETMQVEFGNALLSTKNPKTGKGAFNLALRVRGLTIINIMLDKSQARDRYLEENSSANRFMSSISAAVGSAPDDSSAANMNNWMTGAWLAQWMHKNGVLATALGKTMETHIELIKRAENVLYFLAKQDNKLNAEAAQGMRKSVAGESSTAGGEKARKSSAPREQFVTMHHIMLLWNLAKLEDNSSNSSATRSSSGGKATASVLLLDASEVGKIEDILMNLVQMLPLITIHNSIMTKLIRKEEVSDNGAGSDGFVPPPEVFSESKIKFIRRIYLTSIQKRTIMAAALAEKSKTLTTDAESTSTSKASVLTVKQLDEFATAEESLLQKLWLSFTTASCNNALAQDTSCNPSSPRTESVYLFEMSRLLQLHIDALTELICQPYPNSVHLLHHYVGECIRLVRSNTASLACICFLKKLLQEVQNVSYLEGKELNKYHKAVSQQKKNDNSPSYPASYYDSLIYVPALVEFCDKEHDLLPLLLYDITKQLGHVNQCMVEAANAVAPTSNTFREALAIRLSFLHTIMDITTTGQYSVTSGDKSPSEWSMKLDFQHINMLWIQFSICGLQDMMLNFIGEICPVASKWKDVASNKACLTADTLLQVFELFCGATSGGFESVAAESATSTRGGNEGGAESGGTIPLDYAKFDMNCYKCVEKLFVMVNLINGSLQQPNHGNSSSFTVVDYYSLLGLNCIVGVVLNCHLKFVEFGSAATQNCADDENVVENATNLLIHLHISIFKSNGDLSELVSSDGMGALVWGGFAENCMQLLCLKYNDFVRLTGSTSPKHHILEVQMTRLLNLLSQFLDEISQSFIHHATIATANSNANNASNYRSITVFYRELETEESEKEAAKASELSTTNAEPPATMKKVLCYIFPKGKELNITLGQLRCRIAHDLHLSKVGRVQMFSNGDWKSGAKELQSSFDRELLSNTSLFPASCTQFIDVVIQPEVLDATPGISSTFLNTSVLSTALEDNSSPHRIPMSMIANSVESLNALLALVDLKGNGPCAEELRQRALEMLKKIPFNGRKLQELQTAGESLRNDAVLETEVRWKDLFGQNKWANENAHFWYHLRMLKTVTWDLLLPDGTGDTYSSTAAERENTVQWCIRFVKLGGVRYLMDKLLLIDVSAGDSTTNALSTHSVVMAMQLTWIILSIFLKTETGSDSSNNSSSSTTEAGLENGLGEPTAASTTSTEKTPPKKNSAEYETFSLEALLGGDFSLGALVRKLLDMMHAAIAAKSNDVSENPTEEEGDEWHGDVGEPDNNTLLIEFCIKLVVDLVLAKPNELSELIFPSEGTGGSSSPAAQNNGIVDVLLKSSSRKQRKVAYNALVKLALRSDLSVGDSHGTSRVGIVDRILRTLLDYLADAVTWSCWCNQSGAKNKYSSKLYYKLLRQLVVKSESMDCFRTNGTSQKVDDRSNADNIVQLVRTFVGRLTDDRNNCIVEDSDATGLYDDVDDYDEELDSAGSSNHAHFAPAPFPIDFALRGQLRLIQTLVMKAIIEKQKQYDLDKEGEVTSAAAKVEDDLKYEVGTGLKLIEELISVILFGGMLSPSKFSSPKAKTSITRKIGFQLLHFLSFNCPRNTELVLNMVQNHHQLVLPLGIAYREPDADSACEVDEDYEAIPNDDRDDIVRRSALSETALMADQWMRNKMYHSLRSVNSGSFVGVANPSCACYMISCLQQIFMISEFRHEILTNVQPLWMLFDEQTATAAGNEKSDQPIVQLHHADNMMVQLQLFFAFLQDGEKSYTEITRFCYAFKNFDGEPTDVMVQQDASEFMTNFFQQVEYKTMGSTQEDAVKNTFGGMLTNQLRANIPKAANSASSAARDFGADSAGDKNSETSSKYDFASDRPEPFYLLSVPVANKSDLYESLRAFIAFETVDYTWEREKTTETDGEIEGSPTPKSPALEKFNIPTSKRTVIRSLPKHLIFHLKRFEFDFELMHHIKLNDRFEFPVVLDMFEFMETSEDKRASSAGSAGQTQWMSDLEGVDVEHVRLGCVYRLCGVVLHAGTAQSGHYLSLIKDRDAAEGSASCKPRWYEFNDSVVRDFNIDDLALQAFGGEFELPARTGANGTTVPPVKRKRTRNALLLFYERVELNAAGSSMTRLVSKTPLPLPLRSVVQADNCCFWRSKLVYDGAHYMPFLSNLLGLWESKGGERGTSSSIQPVLSLMGYRCAVNFVFGSIVQCSRDINSGGVAKIFALWCEKLGALVESCTGPDGNYFYGLELLTQLIRACDESTGGNKIFFASLLVQMDTVELRRNMTSLLCRVLVALKTYTEKCLESQVEGRGKDTHLSTKIESNSLSLEEACELHDRSGPLTCHAITLMYTTNIREVQQFQSRKLGTFFKPLRDFVRGSNAAARWCCSAASTASSKENNSVSEHGLLSKCLSFYLATDTLFPELVGGNEPADHTTRSNTFVVLVKNPPAASTAATGTSVVSGNATASRKTVQGDVSALLDCIAAMIQVSRFKDDNESNMGAHTLSDKEAAMLTCGAFIRRVIFGIHSSRFDYHNARPILRFLVTGSEERATKVADVIVEVLYVCCEASDLKAAMRAATILLEELANAENNRKALFTHTLYRVLQAIHSNETYVLAMDMCLQMLCRAVKHVASIRGAVLRCMRRRQLEWVLGYLRSRAGCNDSLPAGCVLRKPGDIVYTREAEDLSCFEKDAKIIPSPADVSDVNSEVVNSAQTAAGGGNSDEAKGTFFDSVGKLVRKSFYNGDDVESAAASAAAPGAAPAPEQPAKRKSFANYLSGVMNSTKEVAGAAVAAVAGDATATAAALKGVGGEGPKYRNPFTLTGFHQPGVMLRFLSLLSAEATKRAQLAAAGGNDNGSSQGVAEADDEEGDCGSGDFEEYDSDDDPEDLVMRSVSIRLAPTQNQDQAGAPSAETATVSPAITTTYDAIIRSFHEDTGKHELVLDADNSKHVVALSQHDWEFIE